MHVDNLIFLLELQEASLGVKSGPECMVWKQPDTREAKMKDKEVNIWRVIEIRSKRERFQLLL